MQYNHPATLVLGQEPSLSVHAEHLLKQQLCRMQQDGCFCAACRMIAQRNHHSVVWLSPPDSYKVDDIEVIFTGTRLALDKDQRFFFVLERVELLNRSTANRLLKILEEPPHGYYFILLTSNEAAVLPTIRSRCIIQRLEQQPAAALTHPVARYFLNPLRMQDPIGFQQELRAAKMSEYESLSLVHELYAHFAQTIKHGITSTAHCSPETYRHARAAVHFLHKILMYPPQPGSADLFWKHLFIHFPRLV